MYLFLTTVIILIFLAMLFLNLYFRAKVLKAYRVLVQNQVEFDHRHVFNREKMEREIIPRYPEVADEIRSFSGFLQKSIRMASVLVALITLFGAILMYYR
jgi:hypothetical protein